MILGPSDLCLITGFIVDDECVPYTSTFCEFSPQFLVVDGCKETFFSALLVYLFYCFAVGAYALILSEIMSYMCWCGGQKICSSCDFWIFRMYLGFSMHPFKGVGVEMLEMWMPVVDT
ncbi:hypothetical protein ACB098_01G241700 [Castanea mollissima]